MQSRVDSALETRTESEALSAPVLDLYVLGFREACAAEDHDEMAEPRAFERGLELLDHRAVRYRLARIERLGWKLVVDPSAAWEGASVRIMPLGARTFRLRDVPPGGRIATRHSRESGALGPRLADERSILLPVVDGASLHAEKVKVRDLPVGAVVLHEARDGEFGRIGRTPITEGQ